MRSIYKDSEPPPAVPRLALKPYEAAKSLGVSEKTLWSFTVPRGSLPCIRIGSRVLYATHQLQQWLDSEATRHQAAVNQTASTSSIPSLNS